MKLALIYVPYDSGHFGRRLGHGPLVLRESGMARQLAASGHSVVEAMVTVTDRFPREITTAFTVAAVLSEAVRAARVDGAFPIVIAGNCISCLGTATGMGGARRGAVWFDAHGDFNTPETSVSGFLDGMALATLSGRCWQGMVRTIGDFSPIAEDLVVLAGARDFDPGEREAVMGSAMTCLAADALETQLVPALDDLAGKVDSAYLHLDLDVHDVAALRVNEYAAGGGLSVAAVVSAAVAVADHLPLRAAALTAYDPAVDPDRKVFAAVTSIVTRLAERLSC
jgi:arginase